MALYTIELSISASREEPPTVFGENVVLPTAALEKFGKAIRKMTPGNSSTAIAPDAGLSMGKTITVEAKNFRDLADILAKFDALADEIECSNPAPV